MTLIQVHVYTCVLPSDIDSGINNVHVHVLVRVCISYSHIDKNLQITYNIVLIDPSSYGNQTARRKGVYQWLRETNKPVTEEEVSKSSEKDYLKALFSLVCGQQLSKACRLAQKNRDHKLALLLGQATQNTTYNR